MRSAMQVGLSTKMARCCLVSGNFKARAQQTFRSSRKPPARRSKPKVKTGVLKRGIAALHSVPLAMTLCCEPKAESQEPTAMHFLLPFARFVKPLCSLWLDRAKSQEPRAKSQESRAKNQESGFKNEEPERTVHQ